MRFKGLFLALLGVLVGLWVFYDLLFGLAEKKSFIVNNFGLLGAMVFIIVAFILIGMGWYYLSIKMDKADRVLKEKWS